MLDFSLMGNRIKQRRKELNITQNQFAETLQISNNHLSTIENGKSHASIELFCQICVELNVTPDYLLSGQLHPNDVPRNIQDMLRLCNDEDLAFIQYMVEFLISRHNTNPHQS